MASLQDFISRRNTARNSNSPSRPQSPEKTEQRTNFGSLSQIPVARVASRNSTANIPHVQTKIEDNDDGYEDDFKDSEILSLENQDDQQNHVNKQLYQSQQRVALSTEYHQDVYHWQSGVNNHGNVRLESEDDMTEGRSTPRPLSEDGELESLSNKPNDGQDEFYTSVEIKAPRTIDELPAKKQQNIQQERTHLHTNGRREDRQEFNGRNDTRPAVFDSDPDSQLVPFNFDGALEMLSKMGLPLRGTERIVFHDELGHNMTYEIQEPPHPYLICISQNPTSPTEILKMRSEIATMAYIRQYHPSIPTPEVVYHDLDPNNAAGIPFMVIRSLKGEHFHDVFASEEALRDKKKSLTILEKLARIHTEMLKPIKGSSLDSIGDIFWKKDKSNRQTFVVGPYVDAIDDNDVSSDKDPITLPSAANLLDLCTQIYQVSESKSLSSRRNRQVRSAKRRLAGLLGLLDPPPQQLSKLSLFHTSLNFSSILVNPSTLDITCVFNWRDAHVLPFLMTVVYPAELRNTGIRSEWRLWVDDEAEGEEGGEDGRDESDWLWGLRGVYEARLAKYDARYAGDVWEDEEVERWLKIWEVVSGGPERWIEKSKWIEQMFGELAVAG